MHNAIGLIDFCFDGDFLEFSPQRNVPSIFLLSLDDLVLEWTQNIYFKIF